MTENIQNALTDLLSVLDKAQEGCSTESWAGHENGHGVEFGNDLDAAIAKARKAVEFSADAALTQEPDDTLEIRLRQGDFKFTQCVTSSCLKAIDDPAQLVGFVAAGMYPYLFEARLTATPQPAAIVASGGEAIGALLARAAELHEKGFMPWSEAERLALDEAGIDDAAIDHAIGESGTSGVVTLLDKEEVREFARAILVHVPVRATAQLQPRTLDAPVSDIKDQVRKVGGIVHSDGNIFFTNAAQLEAFAAGRAPVAQTADKALLQQALDALDYHVCQTRQIEKSSVSMAAIHAALAQLAQPITPPVAQAEPVAWHTEDHLTDRSATTYRKDMMWRWLDKGWPITPLYTHPSKDADSRDAGQALPILRTALRTIRTHGGSGCYEMVFAFSKYDTLCAADVEWRAALQAKGGAA